MFWGAHCKSFCYVTNHLKTYLACDHVGQQFGLNTTVWFFWAQPALRIYNQLGKLISATQVLILQQVSPHIGESEFCNRTDHQDSLEA